MKALVYDGPRTLSIRESREPIAGEGKAVITVIATGICGSDAHGYTGETGRRVTGQIMGHELVGRIAHDAPGLPAHTLVTVNPLIGCGECEYCEVGETQGCATAVVIGVDPALPGSFAEQLVVPIGNVVPLSESTPVLHGALVEPLAVGYHAVMRGDPVPDDRLVVIGGGPIGQAVAIGARRAGVTRILVSEPVSARRELLERLGFASTVPDALPDASVSELGGKPTLVVDAVGIDHTIASALQNSTTRARIVLVGMGASIMTFAPYALTVAERTLIGSYCYSRAHFESTANWVAHVRPELDLLIGSTRPLTDGPAAFQSVASGDGEANKVMLLSQQLDSGRVAATTTTPVPGRYSERFRTDY